MVVWSIFAQLVIGAATIVAAFRVGTRNARVAELVGTRNAEETANATLQRETAARREEFWKRLTFALTATANENPAEARLGFSLLAELAKSDLASPEDRALARAASHAVLQQLDPPSNQADSGSDDQVSDDDEELR
jgi:hypothetical protein